MANPGYPVLRGEYFPLGLVMVLLSTIRQSEKYLMEKNDVRDGNSTKNQSRPFLPAKLFQPCLMFVDKAGTYPIEAPWVGSWPHSGISGLPCP